MKHKCLSVNRGVAAAMGNHPVPVAYSQKFLRGKSYFPVHFRKRSLFTSIRSTYTPRLISISIGRASIMFRCLYSHFYSDHLSGSHTGRWHPELPPMSHGSQRNYNGPIRNTKSHWFFTENRGNVISKFMKGDLTSGTVLLTRDRSNGCWVFNHQLRATSGTPEYLIHG